MRESVAAEFRTKELYQMGKTGVSRELWTHFGTQPTRPLWLGGEGPERILTEVKTLKGFSEAHSPSPVMAGLVPSALGVIFEDNQQLFYKTIPHKWEKNDLW